VRGDVTGFMTLHPADHETRAALLLADEQYHESFVSITSKERKEKYRKISLYITIL